jgi:hypothetical protein
MLLGSLSSSTLSHPSCCPSCVPQAYNELRTTDKAKDMREQQMLRSQMELAYKTGDHKKAEKLAELLKPVELAEIGKTKRPPATGT